MSNFNPANWYWLVGDHLSSGAYSSASADYIALNDPAYEAWLALGKRPTVIDTQADLIDVFTRIYPEGWPHLAFQQAAQAALDKSDITMVRCIENDVTVPGAWATYRKALRAIVNGTDATSAELPASPAFPAGT